jgi:hypothetical protein
MLAAYRYGLSNAGKPPRKMGIYYLKLKMLSRS